MNAIDILERTTHSPEETETIGRRLAGMVDRGVVALYGDLATGKTCLVKGMAEAAGATEYVHSPTFTLVNEYGSSPKLYHLDLYRLSGPGELADLGPEELFDGPYVCVVEWAERAEGVLPETRVDIALAHGGADDRHLRITNHGLLPEGWQDRFDSTPPYSS